MISIIILHRNSEYLNNLIPNIEKTIGFEYELIVIENKENKFNIFTGYNEGVKRSKGEILCFCHEDLIFHTINWGQILVKHFENEQLGLIGVCGGNAFPACPAPWWNSTILNDHLSNTINTWKNAPSVHEYKNPYSQNSTQAVVVDGAWFCIRKKCFAQIRFDDITFSGFHAYDSDICLQILNINMKIEVIFDILIEHFSAGTINKDWAVSVEKLADKWASFLPVFSKPVNTKLISGYMYSALLTYCYWLQEIEYNDKEIRRIITKYLKKVPDQAKGKDFLLLHLWKYFGYSFARIPYKILKHFF